jgi:hypothetical protein
MIPTLTSILTFRRRSKAALDALVFLGVVSGLPLASETQNKNDDILIQRVVAGDTSAIAEAGKTGNKIFVPYLKEELKDRRNYGTSLSPIGVARLALAKLGERQQQQELWCLALTDDPPLGDFGYVSGWYAIQALQEFFTPQGPSHSYRRVHKEKRQDFSYLPPRYSALKTLTELVPNPPAKFDPDAIAPSELERSAKIWREWIAAHKDELSKLQPTGEGVDFSDKACKNGKPTKKRKD